MNFQGQTPLRREARLRYLDADFEVLREGDHVRCAATGEAIPLASLRYWDVARQQPYKTASIAFAQRPGGGAGVG